MENGEQRAPSADFQTRTFQFALRVVRLSEALPKSDTCRTLAKQLLRAGTSVGANARAAKRSRSRAEFVSKMGIVEEEADEVIYWIDLLAAAGKVSQRQVQSLRREAEELLSISVASIKTARARRDASTRSVLRSQLSALS